MTPTPRQLPALSPQAKAYAAAAVTFLVTVLAATLPILDGTAATLATIILGVASSYGLVYAVPNKNYPQRAKPKTGLVQGVLTDAGDLLTPKDSGPDV